MINITKIDENLSIFKENKVIIQGVDDKMFLLLKSFEIDIFAFFDDERTHEKEFCDIEIISTTQLEELAKENDDLLIQFSEESFNTEKLIENLENMGITNYIHDKETTQILNCIIKAEVFKNVFVPNESKEDEKIEDNKGTESIILNKYKQIFYRRILDNENGEALLVCMPRKTGDFTINNTLNEHKITFFNMWHNPEIYDKDVFDKFDKVKIITAVREPISQKISNLYEEISQIEMSFMRVINDRLLENGFTNIDDVVKNGGDVQKIFDRRNEISFKQFGTYASLEAFFSQFNKNICNITESEFNKEKGCMIIKSENIEVFAYQLEKLNEVVEDLAEFVGSDFKTLSNGNVAKDKWVSSSYEKAKKELVLTKEFVSDCYNSSYVNHFYKAEEIEMFKNKWNENVVK